MDCCMNVSTTRVPARRRFVPLFGRFLPALHSVDGSPSICLKSNVHRLSQTAEQLHAVGIICHSASFSFVRSYGRHIGGQIIPFLSEAANAAALPICI